MIHRDQNQIVGMKVQLLRLATAKATVVNGKILGHHFAGVLLVVKITGK